MNYTDLHPELDSLENYLLGRANGMEEENIQKHLQGCRRCIEAGEALADENERILEDAYSYSGL